MEKIDLSGIFKQRDVHHPGRKWESGVSGKAGGGEVGDNIVFLSD